MISWTGVSFVTGATGEVVSTAEAKTHLRVDFSDDDTIIGSLVTAVRASVEKECNRAFLTQTLDVAYPGFPAGRAPIILPRPPLQSVTSVTYYKDDGTSATVATGDMQVDTTSFQPRIWLDPDATWPTDKLRDGNGVIVRIVAGYGAAAAVPEHYKAGIKLLVGDYYENREDTVVGTVVGRLGIVDRLLGVDRVRVIA